MDKPTYVHFFNEFGIEDVPMVGGKNASLGEMYQKLSNDGVRVPNGFATTADAYRYMLKESGAEAALHEALDGLVANDMGDLARRASSCHPSPWANDGRDHPRPCADKS